MVFLFSEKKQYRTQKLSFSFSLSFASSKNSCGQAGLAEVLKALSYSPSIEELILTDMKVSGGSISVLTSALGKLFELTVTLKKVCVCM